MGPTANGQCELHLQVTSIWAKGVEAFIQMVVLVCNLNRILVWTDFSAPHG